VAVNLEQRDIGAKSCATIAAGISWPLPSVTVTLCAPISM